MKNQTIDYINIGLLIIAFVAAIILPFELFLFSYAFLGPLHYLTEINWLYDKKYFIKPKFKLKRVFIGFAVIIAMFPLLKYMESIAAIKALSEGLGPYRNSILLLSGFLFSMALIFIDKIKYVIASLPLSLIVAIVCALYIPKIIIVAGVFLPTIIHVYLFTLLFMIYGLLRTKSLPGLVCVLLVLVAPFFIFLLDIEPTKYVVSDYAKTSYAGSGFLNLNYGMAKLIGTDMQSFKWLSAIGVKIQIFIAFAYTYHYLNWFSKTSIIGWKKSLTSKRTLYILLIWLASIALYLYDFTTGIIALFFLSLLHVVLEFPLNAVTIKEIAKASFKRKVI